MEYANKTKQELVEEIVSLKKENQKLQTSFNKKIRERDWAHLKFECYLKITYWYGFGRS